MSANVLKAIAVTAELTGTELSAVALRVMESDLSSYPESSVLHALDRCRKELTGRLTLAAVIDRLNGDDGRPSADEAWALALDARNESLTVVWTDEARSAFAVARPVLDAGDKIGARMAFRDAYDRIVRDNRSANIPANWSASLGWDSCQREIALKSAESRGLLPSAHAAALLPAPKGGFIESQLFGNGKSLPSPDMTETEASKAREWCRKLREQLREKSA